MTKINFIKTVRGCLIISACLFLSSCQKSFDSNSYKPARTFGGYASSNAVASGNLIDHFSFEGSLMDSVSNTAATGYGTGYSVGIKGQGLSVGLNNYALFVPTAKIKQLSSMTIAFWINTAINTVGIQTPISFVNQNQFWGNLDMFFDGQAATTSVFKIHAFGDGGNKEAWLTSWHIASPWDTWLYISLTYDNASSTFTFYVNGARVGSSVQAGFGAPNFANCPDIVLGTIQFQTSPSLTSATTAQGWASNVLGTIDEVRIYDKALAGSDIKALYQLEGLGL
ncbi:LamG-like jellyroll fold domain-containing protein [Arachidicoccus sp.]|uniref:LamG-like jellyroll fold domain-containing protein n=1 Tax=Arachidicoccus sp. TaxID=1872624 RepID=UPI003D1D0AC5